MVQCNHNRIQHTFKHFFAIRGKENFPKLLIVKRNQSAVFDEIVFNPYKSWYNIRDGKIEKGGMDMGIIRAAMSAVGGALADQWLDAYEAGDMGASTVFVKGEQLRKNSGRNQNKKGTEDYITNGSKILVGPNQFMMLLDGGKVVDYTAEEGYYTVDMTTQPSLFNGEFGGALSDSFERIKFGGSTPMKQEVFFINLQEIKNIKFGTAQPLNYFDEFYNAELFLRTFGDYSIRVTDPLKFFREVVPRNVDRLDFDEVDDQFYSEFMAALSSTMNKMSADGIRISHVSSKAQELSDYMSQALDAKWMELRGMEIVSVGIASVSYDDESKGDVERCDGSGRIRSRFDRERA